MAKRFCLTVLIVAVLWLPVLGADELTVLSPNTNAYSASELVSLQTAMRNLQDLFGDYGLGSSRYFSSTEWMSPDFAAYTAGVLASNGYQTHLVAQEGWPDGEHVWVLVGIVLPTRTAWIPVEASPAMGKAQQILGTIPEYVDNAGQMWFQKEYTAFDREIVLTGNASPVASIRVIPTQGIVGQQVTFMGLASYDPDGEIIRYSWDLGGMETSKRSTVRYAFVAGGTYKIVLTITDSRGKTTTTSIDYLVREVREPATPSSGGGCGCGS